MLVDILREQAGETVTDGVQMYRFLQGSGIPQGDYFPKKNRSGRYRLELFFCCGGSVAIQRSTCADVKIGRGDIVLLSEFQDMQSIRIQEPPIGYCIVIVPELCAVFEKIYRALGHTVLSQEHIQKSLDIHGGLLQIRHGGWSQSVFSVLLSLPEWEQGTYCVLKAAELFYLMNTRQAMTEERTRQLPMPGYLVEQLHGVGSYIENHLDEKLTIPQLCRQFNLSSTTLKNKFREFYGQPIHSWISFQRVQRAAELLKFTDMTVLQIAQSVGYESVSQFNVIFRKTYGTVPSSYRKNVRYEKDLTNSVGNNHSPVL